MSYYAKIERGVEGNRIVERLLALREQLKRDVPERSFDKTLLLATWNIREFDSPAYGERLPESFYYIAEIVNHFDLVAIQEVRADLSALEKLRSILGWSWKYVVTDVTEGTQGNKERLAFLYDSRKVRFGGLSGELVLPPVKVGGKYRPVSQLARTPFLCGFTAGWAKFMLTTVHILYGTSKANDPDRLAEIKQLAQFLKARTLDRTAWSQNLILLGDFNIFKPKDQTFKAITSEGFTIPEEIQSLPSNVGRNRHYDQIAFQTRKNRFEFTGKAGVFNYYESVFRDEDEQTYASHMGTAYLTTSNGKPRKDKGQYYRTYWRTHQISDHLPMWVELRIDFSDEYLKRKVVAIEEGGK